MIVDLNSKPLLRPVEANPGEGDGMVSLRDPSGLSPIMLTMSEPALFIISLFDGTNTLEFVREQFQLRYRQSVEESTLFDMVARLEDAMLLDGPAFQGHYDSLVSNYRGADARPMPHPESLGLDGNPKAVFDNMLSGVTTEPRDGQIVGLIAPHLDFARGEPCYAAAYAALASQAPPDRFVILGTNHFGRSTSVVATAQNFATPLGVTHNDAPFLEKVEERCGPLRQFEYDHAAEHSIELQVCWLQHIYGAESFSIVPFLCPDPCGPTGTMPYDGQGVDLLDFAAALRSTIEEDDRTTIVIAGADFSHVGAFFGDEQPLDEEFLSSVRSLNESALEQIGLNDAAGLRACIARGQNPTRVCSAGCMFTLMSVLPEAKVEVLAYHQAVTESAQNCVTCAAAVFQKRSADD